VRELKVEPKKEPNQLFESAIVAVALVVVLLVLISGAPAVLSDIFDPVLRPCQSTNLLAQALLCR